MEPLGKILIVDDDPAVICLLSEMLSVMGHEQQSAIDGEQAVKVIKENGCPKLVLLDLNLPGQNGLEVLKEIKRLCPACNVILFSGSLTVEDAVEAMKLGAFHCLSKPFSFREIESCISQSVYKTTLHKEFRCVGLPHWPMVIASEKMRKVSGIVERVSQSPASTVLILGESGTGKEVVARHLHHLSDRQDRSFVAVNCAAIPEALIESELFGHERGAFTDAKSAKKGLFLEADGGTLFLDEIGELPMGMQAKLLRALQERVIRPVGSNKDYSVDLRVIAATNQNLQTEIQKGKFREDLFYRLCVIPMVIPPLRDRKEDIIPLAEYFLQKFATEFNRPTRSLSEEEKAEMLAYRWPGNVRELRNSVERAVLLDSSHIQCGLQPLSASGSSALAKTVAIEGRTTNEKFVLELEDPRLAVAERELILKVMSHVHGNKNHAASMLGINRTTLYRKLSSYGIECLDETDLTTITS